MANENIKIVISESGSRVVIRNIREIAESAESAAKSSDKMNGALGKSNNHSFGKLRAEFGKLDTSLTRTVYKIRQMMTLFAAFAGTTISTSAIVKAMDSYTNLQNRLRLVADSQSQVNELTKEMFDIAKRSRASVEDTAIAFSRFDLALKSVGRSQKDSLMVTETVNKMIAMSGKGTQEAAAALLQLSQAFSKGKLDGDEFRTVAETMPLLMDAIAKKMGVTRGELLELRKQGKLTLDVMLEAIRDAQPEVDKQFGTYKMRVSDALTELKNQWVKFWGELDAKMGVSSGIANALLWLSQNLKLVAAVGTVAFLGLAAAISGPVIRAFSMLAVYIAANPYLALGAAIAGAVTYLILMEDELRSSNTLLGEIGANTADLIKSIPAFADDALATVLFGYQQIGEAFVDLWNNMVDTAEGGNKKVTDSTQDSTEKQYKSYSEMVGLTKKDFWGFLEWMAMVYDMLGTIMAGAFDYAYENIKRGLENTISWMDGKLTEAGNLFKRTFNFFNVNGIFGDNLQESPVKLPEYKERKTWNQSFNEAHSTFARDLVLNAAAKFEEATGRSTSIVKKETAEREKLSKTLRGENTELMKKLKDNEVKAAAAEADKKSKKLGGAKSGEVIDKEFYRRHLTIKKDAEAGGSAYTGTYAAAYAFKKIFGNDVVRFGAFKDKSHKGFNSTHNLGIAFDATPRATMSRAAKAQMASEFNSWLASKGFQGRAAFEYDGKVNGNGTVARGDHIHFNFKSVAEAQRFEQFMKAQLSGGGSGSRKDFVSVAEDQARASVEALDAYSELVEKTQQEIAYLKMSEPLRLAAQKSIELTSKLKEKDVELDAQQLETLNQLAATYEQVMRANALRDLADSRKEELASLQAITTEQKAIVETNKQINKFIKDRMPLTEEEAEQLKLENIEHAKAVELLQAKNELWLNQSKELENLIVKQQALNELIANGQMGGHFGDVAFARNQGAIGRQNQAMGMNAYGGEVGVNPWEDFLGSMEVGASSLLDSYTGTLNELSSMFGDFFGQVKTGFADSIGSAIVDSENLGESLRKVGQGALKSLISGIIQMGINWVLTQALMKSSSKTAASESTAQGVSQATALTSAYAPAATLANIATYGSAGAAGMASTIAAVALASAIPAMFSKGFKVGGYTGNGGVNDIAGVVHGQEFVMDAQTTRRIGVNNLEALRSGSLSLSNGASVNGGQSGGITVKIENYASGVSHEVEQVSEEEIRIIARNEAKAVLAQDADGVVAGNIRNNSSRTSLAINSNFDVKQRR